MIKHDFKRIFSGYSVAVSSVLIVVIMLLTTVEQQYMQNSIFNIVLDVSDRAEFLLIFAVAAVPYVGSFVDDFEHKTVYQCIIRCDMRKYVFSRTISIFASSLITVALGVVGYAILLRGMGRPWISDDIIKSYELNGFGFPDLELWFLIEDGYSIIFYIIAGVQFGMLAGIISLCTALLSLFINNKMMTMVAPVIILYIINCYLGGIFGYGDVSVGYLFNAFFNYTFWGDHFFVRCVSTSLFSYAVFSLMIYYRVRRRIRYE